MSEPQKVCSRCGEQYAADVIFCPKDGTPLGTKKTEIVEDPYVGLVVAGQFRIEQLIGIGAMGRVYRAHQSGIERDVAIKILHRELLRNPTVIARFHREAKVASRLQHPNVVAMLMTGELDRFGPDVGGEAYLVMEYLDGISLRSALAASGSALPLPRALHILLQVCDAVGEAHAQGIVHRDLKPENVMLIKRGDDPDYVKALDFGVARIDWAEGSMATQAGVIFGTARYISPEGAQGARVGAPGDVYSLATMLFQCLSGETPFDAESPVGILLKHTSEPAPDIRSRTRASYVPEPIARVIAANLAKNPADRCRDARELGRALLEAARSSGLTPDELVLRSTLMTAGGGGALGLKSIERTKQMNLSPEASAQMALGIRRTGTEIAEPPHPSVEPTKPDVADSELRTRLDSADDSSGAASATRISAPSDTRISAPPSGSSPEGRRPQSTPSAGRISSLEPTLHDEPATDDLRASRSSGTTQASSPSLPPNGTFPAVRPNIPSGWHAEGDEPGAALKRWIAITACFVIGAALTGLVAYRMGAFAPRESGVDRYAMRARAALGAGAWEAPPGENVRDITDAALRRWPGAPSVIAVRREAARSATERARALAASDREQARHLAALAIELDPDQQPAQSLFAELGDHGKPEAPSAVSAPPPASAAPTQKSKSKTAPHTALPRSSAGPSPSSAPPEPAPPPAPAPAPAPAPGGRWL